MTTVLDLSVFESSNASAPIVKSNGCNRNPLTFQHCNFVENIAKSDQGLGEYRLDGHGSSQSALRSGVHVPSGKLVSCRLINGVQAKSEFFKTELVVHERLGQVGSEHPNICQYVDCVDSMTNNGINDGHGAFVFENGGSDYASDSNFVSKTYTSNVNNASRVNGRARASGHSVIFPPLSQTTASAATASGGSEIERDSLLLVLPFVAKDLHSLLKVSKRFDANVARHFFMQLCSAVAHCHSHNIVLRDLKLSKLFLPEEATSLMCEHVRNSAFTANPEYATAVSVDGHGISRPPFVLGMGSGGTPRSAGTGSGGVLLNCLMSAPSTATLTESQQATSSAKCLGSCLQLVDFERACVLEHPFQTFTDAKGSPAYVAPEILDRKPYLGQPADMWSLGIILYTMLVGVYPFVDSNPANLFQKIRQCQLILPSFLSIEAKSLLVQLLNRNPNERITAQDALNHVWFTRSEEEYRRQASWQQSGGDFYNSRLYTRLPQQIQQQHHARTHTLFHLNHSAHFHQQELSDCQFNDRNGIPEEADDMDCVVPQM